MRYDGICLPKPLLDEVSKAVDGIQYINRVDFIRQAIRNQLNRTKKRGD